MEWTGGQCGVDGDSMESGWGTPWRVDRGQCGVYGVDSMQNGQGYAVESGQG